MYQLLVAIDKSPLVRRQGDLIELFDYILDSLFRPSRFGVTNAGKHEPELNPPPHRAALASRRPLLYRRSKPSTPRVTAKLIAR